METAIKAKSNIKFWYLKCLRNLLQNCLPTSSILERKRLKFDTSITPLYTVKFGAQLNQLLVLH